MKNFSNIASCLTNLLKKSVKFEWIENCDKAFHELGQRLTTALILALPIEGKECIIYTDASRNGLGFVLMQEDNMIAYAS